MLTWGRFVWFDFHGLQPGIRHFDFLVVSLVEISYVSGLKVAYLQGYLQDVSGLKQSRSQ